MALPMLTDQQRAEALVKATEARRRRAALKADLKSRKTTLAEVFERAAEDPAIANMRAQDLLQSLPRVGPQRAATLMDQVGIAKTRRVRGLGPVQRKSLLELFK